MTVRELMTAEEVAQVLRVGVVTVRRIVRNGTLPGYLVNGLVRVDPRTVDAYLESVKTST